jgi:hypothetical protein
MENKLLLFIIYYYYYYFPLGLGIFNFILIYETYFSSGSNRNIFFLVETLTVLGEDIGELNLPQGKKYNFLPP